ALPKLVLALRNKEEPLFHEGRAPAKLARAGFNKEEPLLHEERALVKLARAGSNQEEPPRKDDELLPNKEHPLRGLPPPLPFDPPRPLPPLPTLSDQLSSGPELG